MVLVVAAHMGSHLSFVATLICLPLLTLLSFLIYHFALPRPLQGIPYDVSSSKKLLGDVPKMLAHIEKEEGTFVSYLTSQMRILNAPLIQVFIRPFSKPLLVMGDFPEAHAMLIQRKEFDRSSTLGDLVYGLAPDHHIHHKTNDSWRAQRRLVQDLMTPSFLHKVAAPVLHRNINIMIQLWRIKAQLADGRPWSASQDINLMSLDAVTAFAFGAKFNHSAVRPTVDLMRGLQQDVSQIKALRGANCIEKPLEFPRGQIDDLLQAILDLTETVGDVQGNPSPKLTWAYVMRKPRIRRAATIKDVHWVQEIRNAVKSFEASDAATEVPKVQSAVDQMVLCEKNLAEKEARRPNYFSRIMIDEVSLSGSVVCYGWQQLK